VIPVVEIKEKAVYSGVPISTIERDYAQNHLLAAPVKINMALKGGTAIRKLYVENYRFSDDLDFTMCENIEISTLKGKIRKVVTEAREESGINFSRKLSPKEGNFKTIHRDSSLI